MLQQRADQRRVEGNLDGAQPAETDPDRLGVEAVLEEGRDVSAPLDAGVGQGRGPAASAAVELRVAELVALGVSDRRAVGLRFGPACDGVGGEGGPGKTRGRPIGRMRHGVELLVCCSRCAPALDRACSSLAGLRSLCLTRSR